MGIEIREVASGRELKTFVRFPFQLYRGNPYWVPGLEFDELNTLRRDRNPAFEYCDTRLWIAYRDGVPVGRIAGIINRRYIEKWNNRYARFGWIDYIDDESVCRALVGTVEEWARLNGLSAVHGPLGFTDLDREGMLVEGFQELGTLATIYNHPYYPKHLEACGYRKDIDWVEFQMKTPAAVPEKMLRVAEIASKRYKLRALDLKSRKELMPYAKGIFEVLDAAYAGLYGVVPLTDRQVAAYIEQYFEPGQPGVHQDRPRRGGPGGRFRDRAALALPRPPEERGQAAAVRVRPPLPRHQAQPAPRFRPAVRPDLQGKGVDAIFTAELTKTAIKNGVTTTESNPELETNLKVQSHWDYFDGRRRRRRRCYLKALEACTIDAARASPKPPPRLSPSAGGAAPDVLFGSPRHVSLINVIQLLQQTSKSGRPCAERRQGKCQARLPRRFVVSANHANTGFASGRSWSSYGSSPARRSTSRSPSRPCAGRPPPLITLLVETGP